MAQVKEGVSVCVFGGGGGCWWMADRFCKGGSVRGTQGGEVTGGVSLRRVGRVFVLFTNSRESRNQQVAGD